MKMMRISRPKKLPGVLLLAALYLAIAFPAHARVRRKDHCPHTPENPSIILFLAGSAAMGLRYLRARFL